MKIKSKKGQGIFSLPAWMLQMYAILIIFVIFIVYFAFYGTPIGAREYQEIVESSNPDYNFIVESVLNQQICSSNKIDNLKKSLDIVSDVIIHEQTIEKYYLSSETAPQVPISTLYIDQKFGDTYKTAIEKIYLSNPEDSWMLMYPFEDKVVMYTDRSDFASQCRSLHLVVNNLDKPYRYYGCLFLLDKLNRKMTIQYLK